MTKHWRKGLVVGKGGLGFTLFTFMHSPTHTCCSGFCVNCPKWMQVCANTTRGRSGLHAPLKRWRGSGRWCRKLQEKNWKEGGEGESRVLRAVGNITLQSRNRRCHKTKKKLLNVLGQQWRRASARPPARFGLKSSDSEACPRADGPKADTLLFWSERALRGRGGAGHPLTDS